MLFFLVIEAKHDIKILVFDVVLSYIIVILMNFTSPDPLIFMFITEKSAGVSGEKPNYTGCRLENF